MLLIVGLGNPGSQYAGHRHNVGWMAVDAIHERHRFGPWRKRFSAEIAEGQFGARKALLLKPQTFMNESGRAVGEAARFFKIPPSEIVVIHDEIDLAPSKVRIKAGGGAAGHNGLRSINAHIGNDYRRVRIGVGHPGSRELVNIHVLHDFAKADHDWLDPLLAALGEHAGLLAEGRDELLATRLAAAIRASNPAPPAKRAKPGPATAPDTRQRPSESRPVAPNSESESEPAKGPFAGLKRLFGGD